MRASILIASLNEGSRLLKTVQAVLETTAELGFEVIVVDDSSGDGSIADLRRCFPAVKVSVHRKRHGASYTKHDAALHSHGRVLVFLDGHCRPERTALERLVSDVEVLEGRGIVTPRILDLDANRWQCRKRWSGHGFDINLETFCCGWISLSRMRPVDLAGRTFHESPTLIGCCLAIERQLYDRLRGFDCFMRSWGVEDVDLGIKAWLMGYPVLHDPIPKVGHYFRTRFDNYTAPPEHYLANQIRMAYKMFADVVWEDWLNRSRDRLLARGNRRMAAGLWRKAWRVFEEDRASADLERAYLMKNRIRDEFWFAATFGRR